MAETSFNYKCKNCGYWIRRKDICCEVCGAKIGWTNSSCSSSHSVLGKIEECESVIQKLRKEKSRLKTMERLFLKELSGKYLEEARQYLQEVYHIINFKLAQASIGKWRVSISLIHYEFRGIENKLFREGIHESDLPLLESIATKYDNIRQKSEYLSRKYASLLETIDEGVTICFNESQKINNLILDHMDTNVHEDINHHLQEIFDTPSFELNGLLASDLDQDFTYKLSFWKEYVKQIKTDLNL